MPNDGKDPAQAHDPFQSYKFRVESDKLKGDRKSVV